MKFPRCNCAKWENHPQGTSVVIHVGMFTCKTSLTHKGSQSSKCCSSQTEKSDLTTENKTNVKIHVCTQCQYMYFKEPK